VVWIDFDDDLTFSSTEKVVELYNGDYSASASFTVPAGAPDGTHRMRVRGEYYGWEIPSDPCSALEYGETEDYSFIVGSGATADPTSVSAVSSSLCPGSINGNNSAKVLFGTVPPLRVHRKFVRVH
jgi:hypothetical protein